jgi:hypothetical protein
MAELYLAKTYRLPGASGFGDEYVARTSQRAYMSQWWVVYGALVTKRMAL